MEVVRENEGGWEDWYIGDLKLEEDNNIKDRKQMHRAVVIPSVPQNMKMYHSFLKIKKKQERQKSLPHLP